MVKYSRINLMRRKKKLFPWLRTFYSKYSEKFFNAENADIFEYLFLKVEKEIEDIYLESNEERRKENEKKSEDFFNILNSLFLHFWWQMRWKSCKKWETYWKKVETTGVSRNDSHRKCCIQLLHYMILLSIFLTGGDEQSDWIGRILTAIKSLPDAVDILYSALLLTSDLKKKHISVYSIILKHTLCCETVKNTTESKAYCKVILLFRRLLKLTECQREKSQILRFTSKLKVPSDIQNWLSSQNIDCENLDYNNNLTQELLSRSYPDELLRKLSKILTEDSFCKRKALKVDNIDAYNVPSNVTSNENLNAELDEDMESFHKTNSQNSLNGIRTTASYIAAKNLSSDVNNRIKDTDLNKEIINPVEEMFVKTNFNHRSESLQKNSKNQKLENVEIERDCPKTKKSKSLKESSGIHKKNGKKSKEKSDINAEFETCSKLSVPALAIDECPSHVISKENLVRELDKDLKESLDKVDLQNGMVAIKTPTSYMTTENPSNDVNKSIKDKNINKEVLIPNEEIPSETNINHHSESLQNASKNQKLETEKSVKDSHKKKKAKMSKGILKKNKKKSKEKHVLTALKINGVETCSKLSASALDIDKYPSNVTSNENISGNLNCELNKGLLESLDKTNLQNGLNAIKTNTCITTENPSNYENINKEVLNAIEGMSGETNVNHCSESLQKTSKKQKLGKEESVKDSHKKKKAKISKESSKKNKKHKKKSKDKPDITALKINHEFETHSKVSVPELDIDECPTNVFSKNVSGNLNNVLDEGLLDSVDKASIQNGVNSVKTTTSFTTVENLSNDANKRIKHLNEEVLNPFEGMSGETNSPKSVKQISRKQKLESEASERSKNKKDKVSKIHKTSKKISKEKLDKISVKVIERLEPKSKLNVDINVSSNVSLEENVSENLNGKLDVDLPESVVQNDLNDINNMIKDKDLHNTVSNPMDGKCNEINVACCSESLKKASKKRKLESKKSERRSHKKKKKEKRLKKSVKEHKKNKKKSKEKTDKTTLKKDEEFDTYSKLNIPASDNDIPFKFSLKGNVPEDFLVALLESNASNTQNDFNGVKTTTSCIATERTCYDINGLDIDKDQYDLLSNSIEGIFDKSPEKASKKQKRKNEESERRNHKKKKRDKHLKQSSEDCKENKKKSGKKPHKNKEFEAPCNSQKCKKSEKAEKTVAEISKSSKQSNSNLNSERNRSKSTSNIEELHDFESALDQEEVFHEQPDCNIKTKRRRSKSESEKMVQNHSKKSKKLSRDKKITKYDEITEFDPTGTILPVENFSESKNILPQIKNQSQSKKVKKHFSEKLQMPNECLNISGIDNSDTIFSVNNFSNPENIQHDNSIIETNGKKTKEKDKLKDISEEEKSSDSVSENNNYNELFLRKENTVNIPKKSPKVKRKKLFKDSHYLNNSQKEIQCNTTITNNCTVPVELSPSKRHSFLDDDASGNIDMSSINSNIDSNFSSSEETTTFSDVSVSEILNFPVDIYRHNAALGLSPKTKRKKKPNSNIKEQNREFSLFNNDLLMASKNILQQSISEPFKSQSCIDNKSGAKGTEKSDNQNAGMLSFCSTNISESGVDSDFVGGNKVPKKFASTAVLTSKQSNEVKSTSIFQQSQFTNNTEDTFLSMNCSYRQDFEADINIHKSSSERSFSSFSHSSRDPSVMLNDVLLSKSAQKCISTPEKSFTSISESDREMQYCTPLGTETNLEMSVSHELTSENIAKANELYKETKGAVTDLFHTDKQCNSPCMQNVSTIPLVNSNHSTESSDFQSPSTNSMVSEFQSPSLIQGANSNVSSNEPELLATSVSLSQFNVSVTKSQTDDCGTNTENVNCKSVNTATEMNDFQSPSTVSEIHQKVSEFQSPSLIQVANSNVSSNERELLNISVSPSQFNVSVTKSQTDDCGTNTENVNCKSVSTATEIINSSNSVNSYNNDINSNDISDQVSSIQVTVNFTSNDDCSASKKQQFVAHFGFQTVNNFERIPLVSSVSFSPVNAPTPRINNNNLDSMGNHDSLHIFQFNQSTNSIEKSVNCNKCCDTNTFHKPEKIRQCVALNDSDLNQTLFSNSSPTIVNKSKNVNLCHPKLFSNFASLYGEKESLFHSSICKNESLLSQDKCLKPLTNENLDSPIGESNELSLKANDIHVINNESSYRTSTIYPDESGDDCSHISSSNSDFQTVGSMDVQTETLKVGALSENEWLLSQDGDFEPLTTKNLDSLNRGKKVMNNDSSRRSSTIYSSDSSLSTLSNYSYDKREVSIEETSKIKPSSKRKRNNKISKSFKRIETDSDSSMAKLEPIIIDRYRSCSEEVSSLSETSCNEGDTLKKKFSPVNNRRSKSRNSSKKNNSLSKSSSNKGDDSKKNLSPVNNLAPLTPRRGKRRPRRPVIVPQESSAQQKIITQNKVAPLTAGRDKGKARKTAIVPQESSSQQEIITKNKGYNLRAKKSLRIPKSLLD